jgi:hypothetical protein
MHLLKKQKNLSIQIVKLNKVIQDLMNSGVFMRSCCERNVICAQLVIINK